MLQLTGLSPFRYGAFFIILLAGLLIALTGCMTGGPVRKNQHSVRELDLGSYWVKEHMKVFNRIMAENQSGNAVEKMVHESDANGKDTEYLRKFYEDLISQSNRGATRQDMEQQAQNRVAQDCPPAITCPVTLSPNVHNCLKNAMVIKVPFRKNSHWEIRPVSGGWSNWEESNEFQKFTWVVYIKAGMNSEGFQKYGVGGSWWRYDTAEDAFQAVKGLPPYLMTFSGPDEIRIWIPSEDTDNRGLVTLEIRSVDNG